MNKPKLTVKQTKFVKAYVDNDGNGTKAALESYNVNNEKTASVVAAENLAKPSIRGEIDKAMEKLNLTPERALKPIDEALNSDDLDTRLKGTDRWLKIIPKEGQITGGTIIFNQGDVVSSKYVKD